MTMRWPVGRTASNSNGLFKTEVIRRRGPWRNMEAVEFAPLEWVDWFNNRRLLEPIATSRRPRPKHATMLPSRRLLWRPHSNFLASGKPGAVHLLRGNAQ